jgi:hypothetical protein
MTKDKFEKEIKDVLTRFTGGKWGIGATTVMIEDVMNTHLRDIYGDDAEKGIINWKTGWEDGE